MIRFNALSILAVSVLLITLSACKRAKGTQNEHQKEANATRPNVLFFLVDDLGWKDLGCYGSEFYETPNIDRLASKSVVFTNAYTPNPVCSPTRAAILTGKYPSRIGITDWIPGNDPKNRKLLGPQDYNELLLKEVTIAEELKKSGYSTFFAGKWHLGHEGHFPEDQGFDINKGGHHKGSPPGGYYSPYKNPKLTDGPEGEYLTDRLADESIRFMEENTENPFLLYLSFYTVHTPIQASKKHIEKFKEKRKSLKDSLPIKLKEGGGYTVQNQYNAAYASMVYALDENVGRVLDKLDELGLSDNTLIIFTSDNGGLSTLQNERSTAPTSVKPLRAGKGWAYEGGVRVPLIIKKPGEIKGSEVDSPVMSMDFYPTILDVLNLDLKPQYHVDGVSLTPLLNGDTKQVHETLFWDYPHYHGSAWVPGAAVRKGDWKLIHFYEDDSYELYNVKEDISEQDDKLNENPEKFNELKQELEKMIKETGAVAPTPNPNWKK